jgi:hypothetical protein
LLFLPSQLCYIANLRYRFKPKVVKSGGPTTETATSLNGYSIIRAEDRDEVIDLDKDNPLLALGDEYAIEVFEVPGK